MYLEIDKKVESKLAIIEDTGNSYTYGDLVKFTKEFINYVKERELVFILCKNSMGAIAAHIACIENRIVPLMVSCKMDKELMDNLISLYEPKYLWVPKEDAGNYQFEQVYEKFDFLLLKTGYTEYALYNELAMLLTTSGSTGSPKLVRHCYKNLYENAKNVANIFQFDETDKAWIDLQLHYTMGLNVACSNLYAGATLCMTTLSAMEPEYWKFYNESKITNMTGVPYHYEMLTRLKFFEKSHPSLKILAEGGGKLTDGMFELCASYCKKNGIKFFATFGTSETTARLAFLDPNQALERIGSIGKALPGGELTLIDEDGILIEGEGIGELVYSGPNVTLGYALSKEDLLLGDLRQGIFYTGDIAKRDIDGYYYIIGRKTRFIKLYGLRVGLDESEQLIKKKFDIECACVGSDEKMVIYITQKGIEQELRKFMAEKIKIPIAAFDAKVIDKLPKNEVGKILYKELSM